MLEKFLALVEQLINQAAISRSREDSREDLEFGARALEYPRPKLIVSHRAQTVIPLLQFLPATVGRWSFADRL